MEDVERNVVYFRFCGEIDTEKVLRAARLRCEELRLNEVVIASETGRSAVKALDAFREADIKIVVIPITLPLLGTLKETYRWD
jgi:hypothetical protein